MGELDDAIREHLDLKRRRGADPAEVERAEQEALGPVRRGPVEPDPPELVMDEAHRPDPAAWDEHYEDELDAPGAAEAGGAVSYAEPDQPLAPREGVASELFDNADDPFAADERQAGELPAPPAAADEPLSPGAQDIPAEPAPSEPREPLGEPAPPPHRAPLPTAGSGETVEYDVEEALGEGEHRVEDPARPAPPKPEAAAEEDPLEETPEFLQETPDHDRLWFEQRPPRDFDFDG
jgi:hypothetical protein